jgi:hypothetical protein
MTGKQSTWLLLNRDPVNRRCITAEDLHNWIGRSCARAFRPVISVRNFGNHINNVDARAPSGHTIHVDVVALASLSKSQARDDESTN